MTESVGWQHSALIVLVCAIVTLFTRAVPFAMFPEKKELPRALKYLGKVMNGAVMGMLAVYCFRNTSVLTPPYALPEMIASLVTVGLYLWRKSILLPVAAGTVLYMVLSQCVFT